MRLRKLLLAVTLVTLLAAPIAGVAKDNPWLEAAYTVLKEIAKKTPPTKLFLKYHKIHYEAFKAVLKRVDDSKKMSKELEAVESNFSSLNSSVASLIAASSRLPSDPLAVMGKKMVGTLETLDYVRKYNESAHELRKSLTEAQKLVRQMAQDYARLKKEIGKKSDFTRKFLNEELTLFEMRMSNRYGPSFENKLRQLSESLDEEVADTWEKIEYSSDILH